MLIIMGDINNANNNSNKDDNAENDNNWKSQDNGCLGDDEDCPDAGSGFGEKNQASNTSPPYFPPPSQNHQRIIYIFTS